MAAGSTVESDSGRAPTTMRPTHAADFVWRCGGAIALHAEKGYDVTVVCLSFGERGESAKLWREPGMTLDKVKAARRAESEKVAQILGVHELICFDLGDYPLRLADDDKGRLVDVIRAVQPAFMLSQSAYDPYNTDHMYATQVAPETRMIAQAWGHGPARGHPARRRHLPAERRAYRDRRA